MTRFLSVFKYFVLAGLLIIVFEIAGALLARSWLVGSSDNNTGLLESNSGYQHKKNTGNQNTADTVKTGEATGTNDSPMPENYKSGEIPDTKTDKSGDTYISSEEILSLGRVSLGDKIACAGILSKVSQDVLRNIYSMLGDGVTYGEVEEIKEMLGNYLDEGEMRKLIELLESNKAKFAGN